MLTENSLEIIAVTEPLTSPFIILINLRWGGCTVKQYMLSKKKKKNTCSPSLSLPKKPKVVVPVFISSSLSFIPPVGFECLNKTMSSFKCHFLCCNNKTSPLWPESHVACSYSNTRMPPVALAYRLTADCERGKWFAAFWMCDMWLSMIRQYDMVSFFSFQSQELILLFRLKKKNKMTKPNLDQKIIWTDLLDPADLLLFCNLPALPGFFAASCAL